MNEIVIVDAKMGNLRSVQNAFNHVGLGAQCSSDPAEIATAQAVVLPGVGAFERAINNLHSFGLVEPLKSHAAMGKPLLGICVGMQLRADKSEEFGFHQGLGIIPGSVIRLRPAVEAVPVPNIGWNEIKPVKQGVLFAGAGGGHFYHVHSYHMVCANIEDVAATINYGEQIVTTAVEHGNIFGVQFHPEKSQNSGLDLIERFGKKVYG